MTEHKGLILHVYRASGGYDCSRGGPSSKHDGFTLVGFKRHADESWRPLEKHAQVFSPDENRPPVILVEAHVPHHYGPHLVPLELFESGKWAMFGGNYAGTSDGRWSEMGRTIFGHDYLDIVQIHDRVE